jgi:hypothetical protein
METKDVVLQTRKSMMETGKTPQSMTIQVIVLINLFETP